MVGVGLFTALVVVLQFLGGGIRFGIFSISLVLVPIVVGAAIYGWQAGAWLGFAFGVTVLLSGDANAFMVVDLVESGCGASSAGADDSGSRLVAVDSSLAVESTVHK